jgi:hypothetical protein
LLGSVADISIGSRDTEAVDSLEAKAPGRLAQPKHGPHQRPGIISNLLNEPGRLFPALPTRNLGSRAGVFFPPPRQLGSMSQMGHQRRFKRKSRTSACPPVTDMLLQGIR